MTSLPCTPQEHLTDLVDRYPNLTDITDSLWKAYELTSTSLEGHGKLLVCGNGGSSADADHIVGELMKGFLLRRPLHPNLAENIDNVKAEEDNSNLTDRLQGGLPAISLSAHSALMTAVMNDIGADLVFAQQIIALGTSHDVLLGLSTSGNAQDVIEAAAVAAAMGMRIIGMTGQNGGNLRSLCDVCICVPAEATHLVQELHLPVYHVLCAMLESRFFGSGKVGS